jgi:hypothetical protein
MKKEKKIKIVQALEGIKEFEVSFCETVTYAKKFKAKNEEELEEKFRSGELEFYNNDICDGDFVDGSLEIDEVENEI